MKTIKRIFIFMVLFLFAGQCFSVQQAAARRSIALSPPTLTGEMNFEQLLENLHDVREFSSKGLSTNQLGQIAWAAGKIFGSGLVSKEAEFPDGMNLNLYFVIPDGVFEYDPKLHILKELTEVDVRPKISKASSDENIIADCPCTIIIAAEIKKLARQSGLKTERIVAIQAGRVAQNIQTQAVAIGLGSTAINDFDITSVRMLGRLPSSVEPISIICIGYPAVTADKEIQPDNDQQN
ncbi:MAG TPA: nitroreductase family protein, partial [Sedimentisphaerales bacterium]|nr:nitroreductase family protein [Sedimentisphaerales bacterium]